MTFEQMQALLKAVVETQQLQNQSLKLHSELITRSVLGLDAVSNRLDAVGVRMDAMAQRIDESFAKHELEMSSLRLAQLETTDKLNALIDIVQGLVGGKQ